MIDQVQFRRVLGDILSQRKQRNPSYSLRKFAIDLKQSPAALSQILNGKRKCSLDAATTIAQCLELGPHELGMSLWKEPSNASPEESKISNHRSEVKKRNFKIVSQWEHFALLSLLKTRSFKSEPSWIAKRLSLPLSQVASAIETLCEAGLLKRAPDGTLSLNGGDFCSSDEAIDSAIRRRHENSLRRARRSLYRDPLSHRDFTSLTFAVDSRQLPRLKERIRAFLNEIDDTMADTSSSDEVYELAIQLVPQTVAGSDRVTHTC